jgi:hypothetical protein
MKLVFEQTTFAPAIIATFFTYMGAINGRSLMEVQICCKQRDMRIEAEREKETRREGRQMRKLKKTEEQELNFFALRLRIG